MAKDEKNEAGFIFSEPGQNMFTIYEPDLLCKNITHVNSYKRQRGWGVLAYMLVSVMISTCNTCNLWLTQLQYVIQKGKDVIYWELQYPNCKPSKHTFDCYIVSFFF